MRTLAIGGTRAVLPPVFRFYPRTSAPHAAVRFRPRNPAPGQSRATAIENTENHDARDGTAIAPMNGMVSTFLRDLRYGLRMALRSPGFTVVAVLTLAIGIAVNTTVFSWIDMMLLRPIPGVSKGGDLAAFENVAPDGGPLATSWPDFRDYRDRLKLLSGLAAATQTSLPIADGAERGKGRPRRPQLGGVGLRRLLRGARREAGAGQDVLAGRVRRQSGCLPGGRHRRWPLEEPLPWRFPRHRHNRSAEPSAVDRYRRRPRGFPRQHAGSDVRNLDAAHHGSTAQRPAGTCAGRPPHAGPHRHRASEARREHCAGPRGMLVSRTPTRAVGPARRRRHWGHAAAHPRGPLRRSDYDGGPAEYSHGRVRLGLPDCLRQRVQSAAGALHRAAEGVQRAHGPGRRPRASGAATPQ